MAKRKALGRGLSALIPTAPRDNAASAESVDAEDEGATAPVPMRSPNEGGMESAPLYIPVAKIAPNPNQPRKVFREPELASLAASIREQGILQPLVVRRRGESYELIIGERRWRASQLAGLDEVPAVVLDATDRLVVEMALVENVQRADLNPMELAQAFEVLIENEGMTQDDVGRRVGLERSTVANHLRLLELSSEIQQDVINQVITMGHAKAILQAPESEREMLRDQIVRQGLSVRAAEEQARRVAAAQPSKAVRPGPARDVHLVALEDRLRKDLQTKIRIIGRPGRGRIELHYFGEAELERLTEVLMRNKM